MSVKKKTNVLLIILFGCFILTQCQKNPGAKEANIVDEILNNKQSFFYLETQNYPQKNAELPIGVFDSGTGGLTVLNAIIELDQFDNKTHTWLQGGDGIPDLGEEYFIYLADQANMPYGNYSRENKVDLLKEHIIKDVQFLLGNKYYLSGDTHNYQADKEPVKAIVIACNTATAYGKEDIEQFLDRARLDIRVIGVIDAGVKTALNLFEKNEDGSIAIMATAATVASNGYIHTIDTMKEAMKYTGSITAFQQAGIGLAGAIDGSIEHIAPHATIPRSEYKGPSVKHPDARIDLTILQRYGFDWDNRKMLFEGDLARPKNIQINSVENYISYHVVSLLEKIRKWPGANKLKAIILGCTHYPFYTNIFHKKLKELYDYREEGKYIYRPFMAKHIELVDPALNTAKELYEYLTECNLLDTNNLNMSEFYISVPNILNNQVDVDDLGSFTYDFKYGRNAGIIQEYVKKVPFSKKTISPEVIQRLSKEVPSVFELIRHFNHSNPKTNSIQMESRIND